MPKPAPDAHTLVVQLPGFRELTERLRETPGEFEEMANTLAGLDREKDLATRLQSVSEVSAGLVGDTYTQHYLTDWLGEWWGGVEEFEPALRHGYVDTLQAALKSGLPVDGVWIPGAAEQVQVTVLDGPHQVTMLILTPEVPGAGRSA